MLAMRIPEYVYSRLEGLEIKSFMDFIYGSSWDCELTYYPEEERRRALIGNLWVKQNNGNTFEVTPGVTLVLTDHGEFYRLDDDQFKSIFLDNGYEQQNDYPFHYEKAHIVMLNPDTMPKWE